MVREALTSAALMLCAWHASGADAEVYSRQHREWAVICTQDEMTDEVSCLARAAGRSDARNARFGLALSVQIRDGWTFSVRAEDLDGSSVTAGWLRVDQEAADEFDRCSGAVCSMEDKLLALVSVARLYEGKLARLRLKGAAVIDARIGLDGFREALEDLEAQVKARAEPTAAK
jgi:hypothetical protein